MALTMTTSLERAITSAGSVTALSQKMGFPYPSTVSNWRQKGEAPVEQCPAIEAATGIPCEELRPDVSWNRDAAGNVTGYTVPLAATPEQAA